jgi:hypothetical protein
MRVALFSLNPPGFAMLGGDETRASASKSTTTEVTALKILCYWPMTPHLFESQPQLKARIKAMLDVVENAHVDVDKADDAEQRFIEELRQIGLDTMNARVQR